MEDDVEMEQKTTIVDKKKQFIEIFTRNNFNISKTCKDISIDRKKYYKWMESNHFKQKLKESVEGKKDLIEDKLMEEAEKTANLIMEGSPLAIRTIKQMAIDGLQMSLKEALFASFPLFTKFMQSHDFREGPRAFAEKRKPVWKGE